MPTYIDDLDLVDLDQLDGTYEDPATIDALCNEYL